jgi:hypothetical protein
MFADSEAAVHTEGMHQYCRQYPVASIPKLARDHSEHGSRCRRNWVYPQVDQPEQDSSDDCSV